MPVDVSRETLVYIKSNLVSRETFVKTERAVFHVKHL